MNKAFTRLGVLAATILVATLALAIILPRTARAQGFGVKIPKLAVVGSPMELEADPGQKIQTNVFLYGPGQGDVHCATVIDFQVDTMGPVGASTLRKTITIPHMLDVSGRITRVAAVSTGDNWDIYVNGVLYQAQCLNMLPPGEPVIGTRVLTHSNILDPIDEARYEMGASTQVFESSGKSSVFGKSHELTGHVTLMK